ncbi:MAG: AsmA-like C-terminal region-containing protein, partial [Akkermansiaceae bacterium]
MRHRSILHHLKFLVTLGFILTAGILVGGAYYINQSGISDQWRDRIAMELENLGVIADFDSLRLEITKGIVAKGVRIYADKKREDILAKLEHLVIDVDKTKLMRGKIRVNNIALKDADITLPIDSNDPNGKLIRINQLEGEMYLPDKKTIEARDLEGFLSGIHITMDARIWSENDDQHGDSKRFNETRRNRLQFMSKIIGELDRWQWPVDNPPRIKLYVEANTDNLETARIDFIIKAPEIQKNGTSLYDVELSGDYNNNTITLDQIEMRDSSGILESKASYHPATKALKFEARSSLHLQALCRQLLGINLANQLTFSTPPHISCTGTVNLSTTEKPQTMIAGQVSVSDFSFLGSRFLQLDSDFSSHNKDLFLTRLRAIHKKGQLTGRILLKDETIQYEADSTLPASAYKPFLEGSGIGNTLDKVTFQPDSKIHIKAQGTMNRNRLTQWEAKGYAAINKFTYRNTDINRLSGNYSLSELHSHFNDIEADFNYQNYTLKKSYEGPSSASISASSIHLNRDDNKITLNNINGTAWPAPIVRLFTPKVAEHIEKYRFHRPPNLIANGSFGLRGNKDATNFSINVNNPGSMHYTFIGEPLKLSRLQSNVQILGDRVNVNNLSFNTFDGACSGNIRVYTSHPEKSGYAGDLQFRRLHLKEIGDLYQFDNAERGLLTGRIDFEGNGNLTEKFNAQGSLALEKGNLFSVPMLGPISNLIGGVLKDKNPTQESAKDASCTYIIKNGVIFSNDFLATTRSLKFTGEGQIDLNEKEINLLVRMNARGLFGVLAMPLRPFIGLFQFNGTGPISE